MYLLNVADNHGKKPRKYRLIPAKGEEKKDKY